MGLKERLTERRKEIERQFVVSNQKKVEELPMEEAIAEKQKEVDDLTSIAADFLAPFLRIVNEIEFNNEGAIKIKSGVVSSGYRGGDLKEYSPGYAEAELTKQLNHAYSPGYLDSYTDFVLRLRIGKGNKVMVLGHRDTEESPLISINDENAKEKIEDAIFSILQGSKCIYSSGG